MQVTSSKKEIWTIGMYSLNTLAIMTGFMYLNTFATEVLKVPTDALATALLIAKTMDFIVSLFSGAIIEKVKLLPGKNQQWLLVGRWILAICIMLEVFPTEGPVWLRLLVMCVAYAILNSLMNILQTAYYGVMGVVAGPNPANRQAMTVMMTRLGTVIALITAFIPTLVTKMPFGKWNYFTIATVFMLPMPFAFGAIAKLADGKDLPVGAGGQIHQITPADMIGALTENKMLLALFVTNTILNISTNITSGIGSYYWIYVAGDFSLMTIASLVGSVAGFFAAMIMPKLGQKLGKKRAISIGYFIGPCVNLLVGIMGRYSWYYVIAGRIVSTFIMYAYSPFVMLLYMDAGEYHFNKTGKDTRGIVMGLSSPPMKIGMAVGGTIGLWLLGRTGYQAGFTPSPDWVNSYMFAAYIIPACIALVAACVFVIFYRLSDEDAARAAQENYAKLQADLAASKKQSGRNLRHKPEVSAFGHAAASAAHICPKRRIIRTAPGHGRSRSRGRRSIQSQNRHLRYLTIHMMLM